MKTVFADSTDPIRRQAEEVAIANGCRLENDGLLYNAFGIAVARYLGTDDRGIRFENLRLEADWEKAKIFQGRGIHGL